MFGNQPGLGAVGQVAVGEEKDRRHVVDGQADRLEGHRETVGRRARGEDGHGTFAVAAEHRLEQVGLFRLGRQAGARAAALDVDDDAGQFGHDRQADGFGFEAEPGPAGRR